MLPTPRPPRLAPVPVDRLDDEQREILKHYFIDGELYNVFGMFINNPRLFKGHQTFSDYIMRRSSLEPRHKEIAILRIGWLNRSRYEFIHHARMGQAAGLTRAEIGRITVGPDAPEWTPLEAAILSAVDEIKRDADITDKTYAELSRHLNAQQLIDLVMTVGNYNMVSSALNIFGVQLEASAEVWVREDEAMA